MSNSAVAPDKFYLFMDVTCKGKAKSSREEVTISATVDHMSTWYLMMMKSVIFLELLLQVLPHFIVRG